MKELQPGVNEHGGSRLDFCGPLVPLPTVSCIGCQLLAHRLLKRLSVIHPGEVLAAHMVQ